MQAQKHNLYAAINQKRILIMVLSAVAVVVCLIFDMCVGSSNITVMNTLATLFDGPGAQGVNTLVIWNIRLPMTLTCVFVGGALGVSGLQVQTLTNNGLASPYTLGVASGASFGAAISITTGFSIAGYLWLGTTILAFLFALGVSMVIFYMGKYKGMATSTLILTGIVMNFFFSALQQFLQYRAPDEVAKIISSWTFGNLARASWVGVGVNGIVLFVCVLLLLRFSWQLTALSAGEERAYSLGVQVEKLRFSVFLISSVLVAVAVSFIGTVGFVGLVVPHCARMLLGEDQRFLLPVSALFGGILMLLASIASKLLSVGSMLPVGIVTSLVGVPFLFGLLLRRERGT